MKTNRYYVSCTSHGFDADNPYFDTYQEAYKHLFEVFKTTVFADMREWIEKYNCNEPQTDTFIWAIEDVVTGQKTVFVEIITNTISGNTTKVYNTTTNELVYSNEFMYQGK